MYYMIYIYNLIGGSEQCIILSILIFSLLQDPGQIKSHFLHKNLVYYRFFSVGGGGEVFLRVLWAS